MASPGQQSRGVMDGSRAHPEWDPGEAAVVPPGVGPQLDGLHQLGIVLHLVGKQVHLAQTMRASMRRQNRTCKLRGSGKAETVASQHCALAPLRSPEAVQ